MSNFMFQINNIGYTNTYYVTLIGKIIMRVIKLFLYTSIIVSFLIACTSSKQVALVIGNSQYQSLNHLPNPKHDAHMVAKKLKSLGFDVISADGQSTGHPIIDMNKDEFGIALKNFSQRAEGAEIAMVYYAGHGMLLEKGSYLLPVDVPNSSIEDIQNESIALNDMLNDLDGKAQLTVAVFDACREIPGLSTKSVTTGASRSTGLINYSRSVHTQSKSLSPSDQPRGLGRVQIQPTERNKGKKRSRVIAFSGAAGELVKDGDGLHSPYTSILLKHLDHKDQEVVGMFQYIAFDFAREYGGQQPEVLIQGVPPETYYLDRSTSAPESF